MSELTTKAERARPSGVVGFASARVGGSDCTVIMKEWLVSSAVLQVS